LIAAVKCKLCLSERKLCKSHIIPEFFFRPMYDEIGRMIVVPLSPTERTHYQQKGPVEKLLCVDCEQRINEFEKYVKGFFADSFSYETTEKTDEIRIVGLDYAKFKLFQLSVMWRASVAFQNTFQEVKLGPHEEPIRQMLLAQDAGSWDRYPCTVAGITAKGKVPFHTVLQPERIRIMDHVAYRMVFGHCLWVTIVSSHKFSVSGCNYFIQENGTLLFKLRPLQDIEFIVTELQRTLSRNDLP
jgi:hypothetical protein